MEETLQDKKRLVARIFLGKCGLHGVGTSSDNNAIQIHLTKLTDTIDKEQEDLIETIRSIIAPYSLLIVREESPELNPSYAL